MLELFEQRLEPIGVIDDDPQAAERIVLQLTQMGASDFRVIEKPPGPDLASMLDAVADCGLVVCDHKLNQRFKVDFYGVDLVAEIAQRDQVGVLITGQLPDEMHRIRRKLAEVPGFWPRERGLKDFFGQVEAAAAVRAGVPMAESKFFRAVVEVEDLLLSGNLPIARVRILGWLRDEALDLPIELLDPEGRHGPALEGEAVAAEVNLLEPEPRRIRVRNVEPDLLIGDRLLQDET